MARCGRAGQEPFGFLSEAGPQGGVRGQRERLDLRQARLALEDEAERRVRAGRPARLEVARGLVSEREGERVLEAGLGREPGAPPEWPREGRGSLTEGRGGILGKPRRERGQ